MLPGIEDVRAAAERIAPHAHRTPVLTCEALDGLVGARLAFKCENFQKGGAFKFRGACNTVLSLADDEARAGVVTHSSGNHAAAVALAARIRGVTATVVMPENANAVKQAAVEGYGARIVLCAPNDEARAAAVDRIIADEGATLVHPYDDARIVAGQGVVTIALGRVAMTQPGRRMPAASAW